MLTAKQFIRTHYGSVAEFVRVMNENGIKVTSHAPERWGAIGMPEKYWGPIIAAGHSNAVELHLMNEVARGRISSETADEIAAAHARTINLAEMVERAVETEATDIASAAKEIVGFSNRIAWLARLA